MHITIVFLTAVEVLVAILLIALILVQKSKTGGGLGGIAGGGGAEEVFGSGATNILTKATIFFSLFFMVNTLGLAVLHRHATGSAQQSVVESVGTGEGAPDSADLLTGENELSEKEDATDAIPPTDPSNGQDEPVESPSDEAPAETSDSAEAAAPNDAEKPAAKSTEALPDKD